MIASAAENAMKEAPPWLANSKSEKSDRSLEGLADRDRKGGLGGGDDARTGADGAIARAAEGQATGEPSASAFGACAPASVDSLAGMGSGRLIGC